MDELERQKIMTEGTWQYLRVDVLERLAKIVGVPTFDEEHQEPRRNFQILDDLITVLEERGKW